MWKSDCVQRPGKIGVLYHGEEEAFGVGTNDGVVDRQEFLSRGECERLAFVTRQVIPRETYNVQRRIMSYQNERLRSYASEQKLGVHKLESSL